MLLFVDMYIHIGSYSLKEYPNASMSLTKEVHN